MSINLTILGFLCNVAEKLLDGFEMALVDCGALRTKSVGGLEEVRTVVRTKRLKQDELARIPEARDLTGCEHHWVIDKPAGPTSRGTCRACGEERDFQNYIEGTGWGGDVSLEHISGGSRIPAVINAAGRDTSKLDDDA